MAVGRTGLGTQSAVREGRKGGGQNRERQGKGGRRGWGQALDSFSCLWPPSSLLQSAPAGRGWSQWDLLAS